jgi:hypothetical protein
MRNGRTAKESGVDCSGPRILRSDRERGWRFRHPGRNPTMLFVTAAKNRSGRFCWRISSASSVFIFAAFLRCYCWDEGVQQTEKLQNAQPFSSIGFYAGVEK